MDMSKRYQQNEHIVSRKIGEETILVPVNREVGELDNVYSLNETAAYIWEQIDGDKDLETIRACIVEEFAVDEQRAEQDLMKCITQFEEMKGIKKADR